MKVIPNLPLDSSQLRTASAPPGAAACIWRCRDAIANGWRSNQFSQTILAQFPNEFAADSDPEAVKSDFLLPMIGLLTECARTGQQHFRDWYLAERRRYAPHQQGREVLLHFFATILPEDERILLQVMPAELRGAMADWLHNVHQPLLTPQSTARTPISILMVGDCVMASIRAFLYAQSERIGVDLDPRYYYLSALMGADIDQDGITDALKSTQVDAIAVSYMTFQGIPLYRSLMQAADTSTPEEMTNLVTGIAQYISDHLGQIRSLTQAPILLHNACGLPLTRWRGRVPGLPPLSRGRRTALAMVNAEVQRIAESCENCFLIDEAALANEHGLKSLSKELFTQLKFRGAQFHPTMFEAKLADEYVRVLRDLAMLRKIKLLLVDFDNTLWEGVMADGDVTHHAQRQLALKQLAQQGILLAAVSKNDEQNVRWREMSLAREDFVAVKINWNSKAQSAREIAAELNLSPDSFLLLDDNPVERELIRQEVPEILAMDATQPATWASLSMLFRMPNTQSTPEAQHRTQMYRQQAKRAHSLRGESNYPALMQSLELSAKIGVARQADLGRVAELVQRTNQFNTTTIRYTMSQLDNALRAGDRRLLVGELSDKFGDLGLVSVIVLRVEPLDALIESFVMSCRAMGFGMERAMVAEVANAYGTRQLVGLFVPSARNGPAASVYSNAGFVEVEPGRWVKPAGESIRYPDWIKVAGR